MALFKKVLNAGIWQTIEVITMLLAQMIYLGFMARILDKSDFGLMAIANSFVILGYIFAESGMGAALIQRKDITNNHINAALQGGILFGSILFVVFFSLSPLIAKFFEQPELKSLIRVIAINFFVLSISAVSIGIIKKGFKFKEKSIVTICSIMVSYTLGISLGLNGYGVWSLVFATLSASILQTIGFFYFAKVKLLKGFFLKEWKELFSFGFGIVLLKMNDYIGSSGINLVLGKIFSPSLLGVFERAFQIRTLPSASLGKILDSILFPSMSEIQDDQEKLFMVYQLSFGIVNTIFIPVALYLIFFSKEIISILLGNGWLEAVVPLQIMFVVLPLISSSQMGDSVIRAKGLVYKNALRKLFYVIVLLISSGLGAYYHGLKGAAIGVTISVLFNYLTMLFLVKTIFKKKLSKYLLRHC